MESITELLQKLDKKTVEDIENLFTKSVTKRGLTEDDSYNES